ncbi:serine/threonine-protein kinase [Nocardia sp. GCM10030253]|uniref:serine/threonine-protein kinase n=1 Tax=Nocardia sp. GCM10030253 TaxID=3273404 RepID=UPI00363753A3
MAGMLLPGTVFAGYLIERRLGSGGMGAVYVAKHPRLPRRDALKVLSENFSADAEFRARFIREAELAARLDHPNIVAVHDRGVEYGRLWIAMQFVDGPDAAQLIARGAAERPPERVLHIVGAAARGLDEAHRAGMLHRDVKPANVLLEPRPGQSERVFVTDFGIARAAAETTALTEAGSILATLAYAAPEQLTAQAVDHRADVYALGGTLYELLTGVKPFPRDTPTAVMQAHLQEPPPSPTSVNPLFPPSIDDVIARAMAKNPDHRYPSCGALAAAASAAFGLDPDQAALDPRPPVAAGRMRKRGTKFAVAAGVALTIVAVAAASAVALTRNSSGTRAQQSVATSTSSTTAATPSTKAAAVASWGSHNYMVKALSDLLPKTPADSGYQGIRCIAVDKDQRPVEVDQPAGPTTILSCNGDRDPVSILRAECSSSRSSREIRPYANAPVGGDQQWERPSGRGRMIWQDVIDPVGRSAGALQIGFQGGGRAFCELRVFGGTSGQDLVDRWWRDAPL